jgi:hypothetical protein
MTVNHIRFEREGLREAQSRVAVKGKALQIIVVIPPGVSVKVGSIVHVLSFHQENRNISSNFGHQHIRWELFFPEWNLQAMKQRTHFEIPFAHGAVKGKDETNIWNSFGGEE